MPSVSQEIKAGSKQSILGLISVLPKHLQCVGMGRGRRGRKELERKEEDAKMGKQRRWVGEGKLRAEREGKLKFARN